MFSTELAARRGVDHCRNLLKSMNSVDLIEETASNQNVSVDYAGRCLSELREQLRDHVIIWLTTGKRTGFLSQIPHNILGSLTHGFSERVKIPTLDMTGLRAESPEDPSGRTNTPKTPKAVDVPPFEDLEVVEVTDSSIEEDHDVAEPIPTVSAKRLGSGLTRTEGIDFSKLDLNFIPSSPLKSSLKETAVQTQQDLLAVETAEASTSYNLDVEVSTSTESDPSVGQIAAKIHEEKVVTVRIDGSLLSKQVIVEQQWKAPLELVRIAEQNISSSFGSDDIESVSAKRAQGRRKQSSNSDDEETANQVSQLDSELSN